MPIESKMKRKDNVGRAIRPLIDLITDKGLIDVSRKIGLELPAPYEDAIRGALSEWVFQNNDNRPTLVAGNAKEPKILHVLDELRKCLDEYRQQYWAGPDNQFLEDVLDTLATPLGVNWSEGRWLGDNCPTKLQLALDTTVEAHRAPMRIGVNRADGHRSDSASGRRGAPMPMRLIQAQS